MVAVVPDWLTTGAKVLTGTGTATGVGVGVGVLGTVMVFESAADPEPAPLKAVT